MQTHAAEIRHPTADAVREQAEAAERIENSSESQQEMVRLYRAAVEVEEAGGLVTDEWHSRLADLAGGERDEEAAMRELSRLAEELFSDLPVEVEEKLPVEVLALRTIGGYAPEGVPAEELWKGV